ncbi:MAG: NAD(P)H-hydrate dehydratase [Acidobacteriia bacterium]|nr:NAD(P)H-hydrate dehydratase [Terriglobia bacterium]
MRILTAAEIRTVDRLTTEKFEIPSLDLMENAGAAVARCCLDYLEAPTSGRILILCGRGNNGGDGLVAARHLIDRGVTPHIALFSNYERVEGDAKVQLDALIERTVRPHFLITSEEWREYRSALPTPDVIIDALLGTGLSQPAHGLIAEVIADIPLHFPACLVISVDLPSGLNADSQEILQPSIRADVTVTMTAPKICLAFPPAAELAGQVKVAPIGSPEELIQEVSKQDLDWLTREDFKFVVHPRPPDSHKGKFGHVLVVGGSIGKTGAAALAAWAALRSGAGLVTVGTSLSAQPIVAQSFPEIMTLPWLETPEGSIDMTAFQYGAVDHAVEGKSVLAVGPGISSQPGTQEFVREFVNRYRLPLVLDAEGLNAFVDHLDLLDGHDRLLVLTPHPGELSRLVNTTPAVIQSDRKDFAREFARRHHVYLVLKGFRTLVASPDGHLDVCPTGNPGMAKGGSGDVLTGMIAALLAQFPQHPPREVISAAVYLHGLAGDLARLKQGEISMVARDLVDCLPEAFHQLRTASSPLRPL